MGDFGASGSTGARKRTPVHGYTSVRGLGVDRAGALIEAREDLSAAPVLIRVLSPALAADHAFLRELRHTLDRLRDVRHANLAAVIAFDASAGAVIEELIDGVTLRHLLEVQGPLEINAALTMFDDCLAALEVLHAARVCHLDVRPESVIVSTAGTALLRDAGIPVPALRTGWRAGTPQYMAPELWAGRPHSPATDLYAATAVLFESLTGAPPYPGIELAALGRAHQWGAIPAESVAPVARSLVIAGMAKDPRDRPSDAAHLRGELDTAARGFLGADWRDNGRTWLAGAAAARADDRLPALPSPPPPPGFDDEASDIVLADLAYPPAGDVPARGWRLWAGVAAAVVTLLAVLLVAAHAITGPGDTPVAAPPGLPVFTVSPTPSGLPSQAAVTAPAGETTGGAVAVTPAPTQATPIPTSDQTLSVSPVATPTPTSPAGTPTPTPCLPPIPPVCPTPSPTPHH